MTDDADSLNASITPCLSFLNGSIAPVRHPGNLQAAFSLPLNVFITLRSSPRQSLSRGPKAFKNQRKSKSMDSHLIVTPAIFKPGSRSI